MRAPLAVDTSRSPHARLRGLPLGDVTLDDGFWARRQRIVRDQSLAHGYRMLEQAGNFLDLRLAAGSTDGDYRGPVFMDSDVYKWLEAVAYHGPTLEPQVRRMADEAIALVEAAQQPDGYLDSYYQVVAPDKKWLELPMGHELYCAGHLIQAAVAWQRFLNDGRLLKVSKRLVAHIQTVFGPEKRAGTPGHPEIELALAELFRETGERAYLDLAQFFIDNRGRGLLGAAPRFVSAAYYQDRVPVRDADEVEGHAVRALYLQTGVADLYLETGERALLAALDRQWTDMVERKLYLTGGVGARHEGEAFGHPYELPNDRAYNETCAAIASIMWSWRMLAATGEAKYADLIERTLFNGFLSGMSLDGARYFYVNPLLSYGRPEVLGRGGHERREWYTVACCPPNVMRLIATLGNYLATWSDEGVQIHQYAPALIRSAEHGVALRMTTDYPWDSQVVIDVEDAPQAEWTLALRLPAWCEAPTLRVDDQVLTDAYTPGGYLTVRRAWRAGDRVTLDLPMPVRLTSGNPRVDAQRGQVAIERGPLVYCLEACDHPDVELLDVRIDADAPALEASWNQDLLGGVMTVTAMGQPTSLTAVPYYAWANRQPGAMRVWVPVR